MDTRGATTPPSLPYLGKNLILTQGNTTKTTPPSRTKRRISSQPEHPRTHSLNSQTPVASTGSKTRDPGLLGPLNYSSRSRCCISTILCRIERYRSTTPRATNTTDRARNTVF